MNYKILGEIRNICFFTTPAYSIELPSANLIKCPGAEVDCNQQDKNNQALTLVAEKVKQAPKKEMKNRYKKKIYRSGWVS